MRYRLCVLLGIIVFSSDLHSVPKSNTDLKLIHQIEKIVGKKWTVSSGKHENDARILLITSTLPLHHYNCVSLRKMTPGELHNVINSSPERYYSIRLVLVPRWNNNRIQQAVTVNTAIKRQLNELPDKYQLRHLHRTKTGSFFGNNPAEKKRIALFEKERDTLEKQIINLPDFHSISFSIFVHRSNMGYECVAIPDDMQFSFEDIKRLLTSQ